MTRLLLALIAAVAFAVGAAAQPLYNVFTLNVVLTRNVVDNFGSPTPLKAHYIRDEWNGERLCSRVLYHDAGYFAVQDVPDAFCEPVR
jgi:hypothetical protein